MKTIATYFIIGELLQPLFDCLALFWSQQQVDGSNLHVKAIHSYIIHLYAPKPALPSSL